MLTLGFVKGTRGKNKKAGPIMTLPHDFYSSVYRFRNNLLPNDEWSRGMQSSSARQGIHGQDRNPG